MESPTLVRKFLSIAGLFALNLLIGVSAQADLAGADTERLQPGEADAAKEACIQGYMRLGFDTYIAKIRCMRNEILPTAMRVPRPTNKLESCMDHQCVGHVSLKHALQCRIENCNTPGIRQTAKIGEQQNCLAPCSDFDKACIDRCLGKGDGRPQKTQTARRAVGALLN